MAGSGGGGSVPVPGVVPPSAVLGVGFGGGICGARGDGGALERGIAGQDQAGGDPDRQAARGDRLRRRDPIRRRQRLAPRHRPAAKLGRCGAAQAVGAAIPGSLRE
jgi:hypothetical protein